MSQASEVELVCTDFAAALDALRAAGMRLDLIYPADDPHTALLDNGGQAVRLTSKPGAQRPGSDLAKFSPEFILNRSEGSGGEGRAGMRYRDLIPGRLGGRYIASHITILDGGPVADWVHYHRIALQFIYVRSGWVRVVYEDQGEPFVMNPGDLVLQPPGIRHRVLESSPGLEVIEIGCPALHETFADHDLELPNRRNPERRFHNQRFLHHVAAGTPWTSFNGGEAQEIGIADCTNGLAEVRTIRAVGSHPLTFPPHDGELVFGFVLRGSAQLDYRQGSAIDADDSIVIPPGAAWTLTAASTDFRLLHVTTARLG